MLKRIVIILLPLAFFSCQCAGADQPNPRHIFKQANEQFSHGHIRKALTLYHRLEQRDRVSGALFINMGISYVRLDSLGMAEYYF